MKYVILIILLGIFSSSSAQSEKRKIIMQDKSPAVLKMEKINPSLLDTVLQYTPDGDLQMRLEVAKNLDTLYVEDPISGNLTMTVRRSKRKIPISPNPLPSTPRDTIYVEDPITGEIEMIIK